jgi:hypothetical protein
MNAFLGIAWSLSGVPGRKSLIWATGGFPFAMDSPSSVPGGYLSLLDERTMLALNDAQVSVYPVDTRGLANSPSFVKGNHSGAFSGTAVSRQISNRMWLQQSKIDTLNDFADITGGKAFYNTNDLAGSFKLAADDASSYYMLGYYLDTKNNKPGWRKLQVKVDKKDTEVRARNGFFVTKATMNPMLSRDRDMANALHSPIEGTGVPMTVQWVGLAPDGDKKKAVFSAHVPGGGLTFEVMVDPSSTSISQRWRMTRTERKQGRPRGTTRRLFLMLKSHRCERTAWTFATHSNSPQENTPSALWSATTSPARSAVSSLPLR